MVINIVWDSIERIQRNSAWRLSLLCIHSRDEQQTIKSHSYENYYYWYVGEYIASRPPILAIETAFISPTTSTTYKYAHYACNVFQSEIELLVLDLFILYNFSSAYISI